MSVAEGRKFGLVVGGAFLLIAGLLWWRGHAYGALTAGAVGAALLVSGLLVPRRLGPIQAGWMGFAARLSHVTTPLLMGVVYLAILTPTGLAMRLLRRNPLARSRSAGSYWVARETDAGRRGNMERQF